MNSGVPTVSVVIPTYNRWPRIREAILSVLAQTYSEFELLVIDDASTDVTEEEVSKVNDERVRVLRRSHRGGGGAARNDGIDASTGRYVAFLDSDDLWLPRKLEAQVRLAEQCANAKQVLYTALLVNRGADKVIRPVRAIRESEKVGDYLFLNWGKNYIQTSSIFLEKELAATVRFRDELKQHQDWDFCLRLERFGARFEMVEEPLTIWNREQREDRVSVLGGMNTEGSLAWLASVNDMLTEKAQLSFRANLVPNRFWNDKIGELEIVLKSYLNGAIGAMDVARIVRRTLTEYSMRGL